MPYKYPILRLAVLICFAVIYFSCEQVIQKKSDISISKEDSAILSEIEHFTSYSDFDSALYVIDSLTTIEKYSNSKVFRLKLLENKSRILIRLKRYQDALDNVNLIIAASQKHIDIKLDYVNPNLMTKVMTDKIRRAISNIIINAIKFSHHYKSINIYTTESENYSTPQSLDQKFDFLS